MFADRINPTVDTISVIVLAKGSPSALEPISTIAENVDAKAGIFAWNIPADIPAGEDYALEFGTSPDMSFAGLFTIKNDANAQPSATSIGPVINSESPSSVSSSGPEPSSAAVSASTTHTQVISERAANVTESSAASASQTDAFGNSASTDSREPLSKVAMGAISLIGVIAVALA